MLAQRSLLQQRVKQPSNSSSKRRSSAPAAVVVRAVAEPVAANGSGSSKKKEPEHFINVIPQTAWEKGIPPVMGAHLMASGAIAPISTSKGAGVGVVPHQFQYPGEGDAEVSIYPDAAAAAGGIAAGVRAAAAAAIAARGAFTLVLSGGSVLTALGALAEAGEGGAVDWAKTWVFFVDERNVDHASPDSNLKGAREALLSKVPVPAGQVFGIKEGLSVQQAAAEYEGRLLGLGADVLPRDADGLPVFDVIALGVGPDGHIASLFPNRPELAEASRWVLPVTSSPKPPPERITMTLPVINAAKEVLVIALGDGKAEVVARALEVQALPGALPAQLVRPKGGRARWVLDAGSAAQLKHAEWESGKGFPRNK